MGSDRIREYNSWFPLTAIKETSGHSGVAARDAQSGGDHGWLGGVVSGYGVSVGTPQRGGGGSWPRGGSRSDAFSFRCVDHRRWCAILAGAGKLLFVTTYVVWMSHWDDGHACLMPDTLGDPKDDFVEFHGPDRN